MKIILDVSAAFAITTESPNSEKHLKALEKADQVLAPDLFYSESTNAAWKYHHIDDLPINLCLILADKAIRLVDTFFPSELLWQEALELAGKLAHPAYDCFYLVLAQREKASLLTMDKRLLKLAQDLDIEVI